MTKAMGSITSLKFCGCRHPCWKLTWRHRASSAVKSVATDAVRHLLTRDVDAFSLLMDPDAKPFDWPYPKIKQLSNVEALMTFRYPSTSMCSGLGHG